MKAILPSNALSGKGRNSSEGSLRGVEKELGIEVKIKNQAAVALARGGGGASNQMCIVPI